MVIAGEGRPSAPCSEALVANLGVGRRVRFVGGVEGGTKCYLLQNALCGLIPSRTWEAFGLVVLESFAAGARPVIATRLAGLEDLIDEGRTGCRASRRPRAVGPLPGRAARRIPCGRVSSGGSTPLPCEFHWTHVAVRHLELYAGSRRAPRPAEVCYARVRVHQKCRRVDGQRSRATAKLRGAGLLACFWPGGGWPPAPRIGQMRCAS